VPAIYLLRAVIGVEERRYPARTSQACCALFVFFFCYPPPPPPPPPPTGGCLWGVGCWLVDFWGFLLVLGWFCLGVCGFFVGWWVWCVVFMGFLGCVVFVFFFFVGLFLWVFVCFFFKAKTQNSKPENITTAPPPRPPPSSPPLGFCSFCFGVLFLCVFWFAISSLWLSNLRGCWLVV